MNKAINSLLIPYTQVDNLLVPNSLVECILPYAIPLPPDYRHQALVGSLIYNDAKIPVLSMETLERNRKVSLPDNSLGRFRIVIMSSITADSFCNNYAIIASGRPSFIKVYENSMSKVNTLASKFIYGKIKLNLENCKSLAYIPNLEKMEEELFSMRR